GAVGSVEGKRRFGRHVTAGASASALLGGTAAGGGEFRIRRRRVHVKADVDLFAGGRVEGGFKAGTRSVKAGASGSVGYGIGVRGKAVGTFSPNRVRVKFKVGGYFGLGGSVGAEVDVKPKSAYKSAKKGAKKAAKKIGKKFKSWFD
ncbi:MAG: hypothetical protein M3M94_01515, partial [Actinomycetota bacterium]|nr:hypothetical protein [Actinomycetota bacterium]